MTHHQWKKPELSRRLTFGNGSKKRGKRRGGSALSIRCSSTHRFWQPNWHTNGLQICMEAFGSHFVIHNCLLTSDNLATKLDCIKECTDACSSQSLIGNVSPDLTLWQALKACGQRNPCIRLCCYAKCNWRGACKLLLCPSTLSFAVIIMTQCSFLCTGF